MPIKVQISNLNEVTNNFSSPMKSDKLDLEFSNQNSSAFKDKSAISPSKVDASSQEVSE